MKNIPTDLEILNAIYDRYYETFAAFSDESKIRSNKVYVPIDVASIAGDLEVDSDIVFGRLYYHLENKYGYKNPDGSAVHFFTLKVGDDINCVQFPYLSSILADLRTENKKYQRATLFSTISITVSVISLLISITSFFLALNKK